ncbi:hypothetical protein RF11_05204 [Thelohanellus kitauei]|uniref:Uncharacterized protein n=1 Tax=Thelohanellus kitauei TaxID=669202 RepID=A0A0C2ME22_THEKT|nr:hypothetical protein RF11_05204 [Thelohanellus kitauei]
MKLIHEYFNKNDLPRAIEDYIFIKRTQDVSAQIEAVRNFISYSSCNQNRKEERLFIENFPTELKIEFSRMGEEGTNLDGYHEKKKLFFDVFNFTFRNRRSVLTVQSKEFAEIFLKIIKTHKYDSALDPSPFIDSLKVCVSYDQNKVLFINENGMFHFYQNFNIRTSTLGERFMTLCQHIYELDRSNIHSLYIIKLTPNVNQIMTRYSTYRQNYCAMLLFKLFQMLHRFRLLDDVNFDVNQFYDITVLISLRYIGSDYFPMFVSHLSKIWTAILNVSINKLEIDSIDKLMLFAGLFAIGISSKLMKLIRGSDKLKMTKNKKQRLYIIYFTFVAFPMIDHQSNTWLRTALIRLHHFFQKYFEKHSLTDFSFETQFLIVQYYIKSLVTLNIEISDNDRTIFKAFFGDLATNPSFSNLF